VAELDKCSLEPFRNPPTRTEIRTCLLKLIWVQEEERRKAKQQDRKIPEDQLPQLWVLATNVSQPVLQDFAAQSDSQWPVGVYRLPKALKTSLVAINQLPLTPDTLWLRVLGKGATQEQAIREVLALPPSHPRRAGILRLLASWRVRIDLGELQTLQDQEIIMALPQAFLDWEQQTQERGREEGREEGRDRQVALLLKLFQRKLGDTPEPVATVIRGLDFTQLASVGEAVWDLESWPQLLEGLVVNGTPEPVVQQEILVKLLEACWGKLDEVTRSQALGLSVSQVQGLLPLVLDWESPGEFLRWLGQ
jgi:hypothetical protein